jgi:F0F1-type ATP synthase gamma subunit
VVLTVATSDRGLCGAFNTNILRTAITTLNELESPRCTGGGGRDRSERP